MTNVDEAIRERVCAAARRAGLPAEGFPDFLRLPFDYEILAISKVGDDDLGAWLGKRGWEWF